MPTSLLAQRLRLLGRSLRWMPGIALAGPGSRRTAADLIERAARKRPDETFVRFEGRDLSYRRYNANANRIAHWALERGIGKGDVVALLMGNRPEYLEAWAGLAKAGATSALLNANLTGSALAHVLEAAQCTTLILGSECVDAWASVGRERPAGVRVFVAQDPREEPVALPPGAKSLDEATSCYSDKNPLRSVRSELRGGDPLFYIYTSGTTGLPKAARFSHARFMGGGLYSLLSGMTGRDTLYCPLPLYHTVGGVMCVNAVLRSGGTLALTRRFSAGRFWREVVEMEATGFQYIGELCRYLLGVPPGKWETKHRIRFCVGNGLRPDVWEDFQKRFRIPHITEFYGATESNVSLVNLEGVAGSIGRPAPGTRVALVRWDVQREEHRRGPDGRCIEAELGEPGELIGKISEGRTAAGRFEGYTNPEATEKKILRNVFEEGDAWFRSGDLLRRDERGFYYFVDRLGDTFRWKGENVSTQEVAEALARDPAVALAAVYGVEIAGCDGRAGMAALVLETGAGFDAGELYTHVSETLPAYARPAFLRVQARAELTGTFKVRKVELQAEGFDPDRVNDPLYYRDDAGRTYKPIGPKSLAAIRSGDLRFYEKETDIMEQLPGADAAFLALETPEAPAHVGGLTILDPTTSPDFSFEKLVASVGRRIRLAPRLTRKLLELPLGLDRPYLVEDPQFDVRNHIRRIAVPGPGGLRELAELVSYLHSKPLHRDRPLWELWFIEGVADGKFAMFMKSHHCLMDGAAGAGMGELLCDLEPDPPADQLPPAAMAQAAADPEPAGRRYGDLEIGLRAARHLAEGPRKLLEFGGRMLRQTAGIAWASRNEGAPPLPFSIPATPFNRDVGPRRAFAAASVDLDAIKAVKKHFDVTVNDVVLAITGTAVRNWLLQRDALPDQSLVSIIAVSKRGEGDDEMRNQVTMAPCVWASDEPDPVERLRKIHRNADTAKAVSANYDAEMLAGIGGAVPPGLTNLFMRTLAPSLAPAITPGNVLVSNVRGTPVPLYVAGARIETMYPLSILMPSQGLNVTVVSYMGKVDVGWIADPDLVDDIWGLAEEVPRALAELMEAVEKETQTPAVA